MWIITANQSIYNGPQKVQKSAHEVFGQPLVFGHARANLEAADSTILSTLLLK